MEIENDLEVEFDIMEIGQMISNGIVEATDPMYHSTSGRLQIPVLPGEYACIATKCCHIIGDPELEAMCEGRPAEVTIVHKKYPAKSFYDDVVPCIKVEVGTIGVDSASAGIFTGLPNLTVDEAFDLQTWNEEYTDNDKEQYYAAMCNYGIVSLAGLGDGVYHVYAFYDANEIGENKTAFAVSIIFI